MRERRLQRTEGNIPYNILTCAPLIILALMISRVVGLWYPEAADPLFGVAVIPMGCLYLWLIGALMRGRWYLEVDDEGVTYRALMLSWHYSWKDVVGVRSERTPGFMGKYDDRLIIEVSGKTLVFFLHDFGLTTKRATVAFIEDVKKRWAKANPSAVRGTGVGVRPDDDEDVYDEEY